MPEFVTKKDYVHVTTGVKYTCGWSNSNHGLLLRVSDGTPITLRHKTYRRYYEEYKEPVKRVAYVNMYEKQAPCAHASRVEADQCAGSTRIACVRVELTEGTWDE